MGNPKDEVNEEEISDLENCKIGSYSKAFKILKERSLRVMLMPHELECLKKEAEKAHRSPSKQLCFILEKRYKKVGKSEVNQKKGS